MPLCLLPPWLPSGPLLRQAAAWGAPPPAWLRTPVRTSLRTSLPRTPAGVNLVEDAEVRVSQQVFVCVVLGGDIHSIHPWDDARRKVLGSGRERSATPHPSHDPKVTWEPLINPSRSHGPKATTFAEPPWGLRAACPPHSRPSPPVNLDPLPASLVPLDLDGLWLHERGNHRMDLVAPGPRTELRDQRSPPHAGRWSHGDRRQVDAPPLAASGSA